MTTIKCSVATVEEYEAELARLRDENDRLVKLTDYLRAGEVNIDEQERAWNAAQAELARLREREAVTQELWGKAEDEVRRLREENKKLLLTKAGAFKAQLEYQARYTKLLEAVKEQDEAEKDIVGRARTGWSTPEAAKRTERLIKAEARLRKLIEEADRG